MKKLLILMLIISFAGAAQAVYFEDNFDHITTAPAAWDRINYAGWYAQNVSGDPYPGGAWNIGGWDGFMATKPGDGIQRTIAAYNHVETFNWGMGEYTSTDPLAPNYDPDKVVQLPFEQDGTAGGVYRVVSIDSYWVDGLNSGPFLYKNIGTGGAAGDGNFKAEVEIVGQNYIWNNLGGLMARDPASATENWVYLSYFPNYNVGNHGRSAVNGVSPEIGLGHGFPCDPYLQLSRVGTTFYLKTSPDGITYTSLPGLEAGLDRPDLPAELQVGIFQANYAGDWIGPMDFDNFVLIPEPATIALLGLGGLALIRRKR